MTCIYTYKEVDVAESGYFEFTCGIASSMTSQFAAEVSWQATSSITGVETDHFVTFSQSNEVQIVTFSGRAENVGSHQLLISAREPGADHPMDTVTVVIKAEDSNAPVSSADEASGSVMSTLQESRLLQAALAGLVLFVLMGTLMIRGQSRRQRETKRRMHRAAELRQHQGLIDLPERSMVQNREAPVRDRRSSSLFDDFKRNR